MESQNVIHPSRWDWVALAIATTTVIGTLLSAGPARSQEHLHPPQDVQLHEQFYRTWMMPHNRKVSCCNNKDCYPTLAKMINGEWYALRREDGKWIRVPPERVERELDMPDARAHLCAPDPSNPLFDTDTVFCFGAGAGI